MMSLRTIPATQGSSAGEQVLAGLITIILTQYQNNYGSLS